MAIVAELGSREYCIHSGEQAGAGIRRAAIGRLDDAIESLHGLAEGTDAAVHEVRKDIKRVRSALRLVRDGIGVHAFERENALFRAAGQLLGPVRDAQIKIETLDAERAALASVAPAAIGEWREKLKRDRSGQIVRLMDELAYEVCEVLETGRAGVCDWPVLELDWELVENGRQRVHGACCRRQDAVNSDTSPKRVHAWRRRAKDQRHHIELLSEVDPDLAAERLETAHRLTDVLGDHNNLAVLSADAGTREAILGVAGIEAVGAVLEARMSTLVEEAVDLGRPLQAAPPAISP